MVGDMGLHVMDSNNPELKWKLVKKGRSSRKSLGRRWNSASKLCDFTSPKSDGDFSGSDTDKLGEGCLGKSSSGKLESVPIKKRRHLVSNNSISEYPSPFFEDNEHLKSSSGDFSGIELLAAAASMDGDCDNSDEKIIVAEDSLLKHDTPDALCAASPAVVCLKSNELENTACNVAGEGGNTDCSIHVTDPGPASENVCRNTEVETLPQALDRKHWDLNVLMDAWDEPCDSTAGSTDLNDDSNMAKGTKESSLCLGVDASGGIGSQSSNLDTEYHNATSVCPVNTCVSISCSETQAGSHSDAVISNTGRLTVENQESQNQAVNADAKHNCSTSGLFLSDRKERSICIASDLSKNDNVSTNLSDSVRIGSSKNAQLTTEGGVLGDITPSGASDPSNDQYQNSKNSCTFVLDGQPLLIADPINQTEGSSTFGSTDFGCHSILGKFVPKLEDADPTFEESKRTVVEGSSRSVTGGACDEPMLSRGKIYPAMDDQQDSDIPMVDEDILTVINEGYDSPYEDGELRGSYMYSWEENECVDYESDGRKDDTDVEDCFASGLAVGASEVCHGVERKDLMLKRDPEANESKSGTVKPPLTKHVVGDEYDLDEIAGRGSNAGSGTTVEHSMEITDENGDSMKRRQLTDRSDDAKIRDLDEYGLKVAKGKLQSRISEQTLTNSGNFSDSIAPQRYRSRRLESSNSQLERVISRDKYMGRHRSSNGVRDEDHWTSWDSRTRCNSDYRLPEIRRQNRPRIVSNESVERTGEQEFFDSRQGENYYSKDLKRSAPRQPFNEREDYTGVRKKVPLTWGISNTRSRDHYLHHADRGFPHLRADAGPPGRFQTASSRSERSYSPCSARNSHIHFPRRRSRSRSRSHSPMWQPQPRRVRTMGPRQSRSPDYRMEARVDKLRVPVLKTPFETGCGEGYISKSRGRLPPQENYRFGGDFTFPENHLNRRRSPVRVFRRPQRFDTVDSSEQLKSNEYYRRRFSFMAPGKGHRVESDYDDRRQDSSSRVIYRRLRIADGGSMRRLDTDNFGQGWQLQKK